MKMIKKAIVLGLGLVMMGSATFAQSLADAKKAIDAEQYQKATSMLKALTINQPSKPENFFSLGDVYLKTNDVDSARAAFTKGVAADAKYSLNFVGLGQADLYENNPTSAKTNFDKAISLGAKDYKTYLYIGKAYIGKADLDILLKKKPDFTSALPFLTKADELETKDVDPEIYIALGDFYAQQNRNSEALAPYLSAVNLNAQLLRPLVQMGRMYTSATGYADAELKLKEAIAADPNYGPAYRELAETQMRWSNADDKISVAKARRESALENYRKYLDLTDKSFESRLRYAQFLVYGADWKTLEEVAAGLATNNPNPSKSLLISRLRGYSAYENGNYPQSVQYLSEVLEKGKAEPGRLAASDYAYLGKALSQTGQDSLAVINLRKATELDSTSSDALQDVALKLAKARKYEQAIDVFKFAIKENPKSNKTYLNTYYIGVYSFYDYITKKNANLNPSRDLLVQADSAYSFVQKANPEQEAIILGRANVARQLDDPKTPVGLAKPFYEKYIELVTVTKPEKATLPATIKGLVESYGYLGYLVIDTDKEKAKEFFNKVLALQPDNKQALDNLKYLDPPAAAPKKTPIK